MLLYVDSDTLEAKSEEDVEFLSITSVLISGLSSTNNLDLNMK